MNKKLLFYKKLLYLLCLIPALSWADSKVSALTETTSPSATDYMYIISAGNSLKIQTVNATRTGMNSILQQRLQVGPSTSTSLGGGPSVPFIVFNSSVAAKPNPYPNDYTRKFCQYVYISSSEPTGTSSYEILIETIPTFNQYNPTVYASRVSIGPDVFSFGTNVSANNFYFTAPASAFTTDLIQFVPATLPAERQTLYFYTNSDGSTYNLSFPNTAYGTSTGFKFPDTGSSGQFLKNVDGAGTTQWVDAPGSSGASTLAVGTGTANNFTFNASSPTGAISFLGSQFSATVVGSTAVIQVNQSSITTQGTLLQGANITLTPGAGTLTIAATSGGGGASTLAVGTGTAANFTTNITSPTAVISFLGGQFRSVAGGSTNFITLDASSVTLQGQSVLSLSSAAATYFYKTSNLPASQVAAGSLGASVLASSFPVTGVTATSYTNSNITVNAQGIITAASNGSAGSGSSIYPATSTILATTYGISASTGVFSSSLTLNSQLKTYGSVVSTVTFISSGTQSVTIDASLTNYVVIFTTCNFTLQNPTNPTDGQKLVVRIQQDGSGSRTLTLGSAFDFGTDITAATLTTTAWKKDFLTFIYDANQNGGQWMVVAFVKGY